MGCDSLRIVGLAEAASVSARFYRVDHTIANFKMFQRVAEAKRIDTSNSNDWEVEFEQERNNFEAELRDGRLSVVLFLMDHESLSEGEIIQCGESMAKKLEFYGIARTITEDEAVEYGRKRRQRFGGWMDDPAWRKFTGNLRRILTAEATRAA